MGLELAHGGHLTHGMKINVSGKLYEVATYGVDPETSVIDMDEVARIAREHRPKMIVAGWSAYPRQLDFPRFREIADEVGAYAAGRHGPLRGLGRGRAAPESRCRMPTWSRPRPTRRSAVGRGGADPVPRGVRQEDQLGCLPGPAGRTARARDRRQGGGVEDRGIRAVPRAPGAHTRRRQARSRRRCSAPAPGCRF